MMIEQENNDGLPVLRFDAEQSRLFREKYPELFIKEEAMPDPKSSPLWPAFVSHMKATYGRDPNSPKDFSDEARNSDLWVAFIAGARAEAEAEQCDPAEACK